MAYFNFLDFPLTAAQRTYRDELIAANDLCTNLFNGTRFRLYLNPGEYTRTTVGEASSITPGYRSTTVLQRARLTGFEVSTVEARIEAYWMLLRLLDDANDDPTAYQAVTVEDYVLPEPADAATGYTVREGLLSEIQPASGYIRSKAAATGARYGQGLSFKFTETTSRRIE